MDRPYTVAAGLVIVLLAGVCGFLIVDPGADRPRKSVDRTDPSGTLVYNAIHNLRHADNRHRIRVVRMNRSTGERRVVKTVRKRVQNPALRYRGEIRTRPTPNRTRTAASFANDAMSYSRGGPDSDWERLNYGFQRPLADVRGRVPPDARRGR
jgi:hypothetical protein